MDGIAQDKTQSEDNACPECGSTHLEMDYVRSEVVCSDCGLVVEEKMIDYGQEWSAHSHEEWSTRTRTGPPRSFMIYDGGLSTVISTANVDAQRRALPMKTKKRLYRMRIMQNRLRVGDSSNRGLAKALREIDRTCSVLGLPSIFKEQSAMIYRKARTKGLIMGRTIRSVVGGVIYAVCRSNGVPRTFNEVARACHADVKLIRRAYSKVSRELHLAADLARPEDYVERFCSMLCLSQSVRPLALRYLATVTGPGEGQGKSPLGIAAAAIYIAARDSGELVTQKEVARVAGVSEVTLRGRVKELTLIALAEA